MKPFASRFPRDFSVLTAAVFLFAVAHPAQARPPRSRVIRATIQAVDSGRHTLTVAPMSDRSAALELVWRPGRVNDGSALRVGTPVEVGYRTPLFGQRRVAFVRRIETDATTQTHR